MVHSSHYQSLVHHLKKNVWFVFNIPPDPKRNLFVPSADCSIFPAPRPGTGAVGEGATAEGSALPAALHQALRHALLLPLATQQPAHTHQRLRRTPEIQGQRPRLPLPSHHGVRPKDGSKPWSWTKRGPLDRETHKCSKDSLLKHHIVQCRFRAHFRLQDG